MHSSKNSKAGRDGDFADRRRTFGRANRTRAMPTIVKLFAKASSPSPRTSEGSRFIAPAISCISSRPRRSETSRAPWWSVRARTREITATMKCGWSAIAMPSRKTISSGRCKPHGANRSGWRSRTRVLSTGCCCTLPRSPPSATGTKRRPRRRSISRASKNGSPETTSRSSQPDTRTQSVRPAVDARHSSRTSIANQGITPRCTCWWHRCWKQSSGSARQMRASSCPHRSKRCCRREWVSRD